MRGIGWLVVFLLVLSMVVFPFAPWLILFIIIGGVAGWINQGRKMEEEAYYEYLEEQEREEEKEQEQQRKENEELRNELNEIKQLLKEKTRD